MNLHNSRLLLAAVLLSLDQLLPQISHLQRQSQHHRLLVKALLSLHQQLPQIFNLQWQSQRHRVLTQARLRISQTHRCVPPADLDNADIGTLLACLRTLPDKTMDFTELQRRQYVNACVHVHLNLLFHTF